MDKVLVLCVAEVIRRYGPASIPFQDSVMITAEFADQVLPAFEEHFQALRRRDPGIIGWRMITYLPQKPLKNWTWQPLKRGKVRK